MKRISLSKGILALMIIALMATSNSYAQQGSGSNDLLMDSVRHGREIPNLTADQKVKIANLRVNHLKEVTPLRNELAEKKAHLKTLESVEKPDKVAINKTIDDISILYGKVMKLSVNHRLEVASNLTDEQKIFFNSHRWGNRGYGMCDGTGKGMKRGYRKCPNCPN